MPVGSFTHTLPVVRGVQSGREYYVTMCPMKLIPKLFLFDEAPVPAELRAQRAINKSRIPEITDYIVKNPKSYTLSAITASVDSRIRFIPFDEHDEEKRLGTITIPMDARLVVNDGQHRRAAIEQALRVSPGLGHETIPVVLFVDAGLKRSQQMFADLNKYAVRPSASLGVLYDQMDPLAELVREVAFKVPLFRDRIDKEKTTISNRSSKLFTLSSVFQATKSLLGKKKRKEPVSRSESQIALEYWTELPAHIPEWKLLLEGKITSSELRTNYVHAHGVVLHALGAAGNSLIANHAPQWKRLLGKLESINWSRGNPDWNGRAMVGGRLSKAQVNVVLTTNYIKHHLELGLSPEEERIETGHTGNGADTS
jgi:DNA sulfur modification protein DndB